MTGIPEAEGQGRTVWIVNHHASVPSKDMRKGRHLALAEQLRERGWKPVLFFASTTHPSGEQRMPGRMLTRRVLESEIPCVWIRSTAYGASQVRRVVGMLVFVARLLLPSGTAGQPRPQVVVGSTVHLLAAWAGWRLARRHDVPFVFEVRDLWPETLVDLGQMSPGNWLRRAMHRLSDHLYRSASLVISPLPGVREHLDTRGFRTTPFLWLPNGTDPGYAAPESRDGAPCERPFTFMYLGAHGLANALDTLLLAFDRASRSSPAAVRLRMVGDGPLKRELERSAATLASASAISFHDRITREEVIPLAQSADCLVANLRDLPVYRYGVSLNKLFDYLLAGRPIILGGDFPGEPVSLARAGLVVAPDDVRELAGAMVRMVSIDADTRREMGSRGRRYVQDHYTYPVLGARLSTALRRVCESPASASAGDASTASTGGGLE